MGKERKPDVQYVNDVIKSSEDKRHYRGLILPNQLRVLLISDPETDKSAASLSVGIGHLSNPDDLPGLAHFCERMLFLGSKKYPVENEYRKFVVEHGGTYNTYTAASHTLYHFDIASEHLEGALDRFAHFFLSPLMTKSAVEREVNSVNLEHETNIPFDYARLDQLRKSFSKNGHPYGKFGTGNKRALFILPQEKGIDVREELLSFHKKWYSANIMFLVILGKESLEDLGKIVIPLFSQVPDKNVVRPEWTDHPYGPDQVQTNAYVVPIKDLKELHVWFPIPDLRKYYKARPAEYIRDLVGHEGPGSLLSALKAKSWGYRLNARAEITARGFGFFTINAQLTDDGIEHINEIVTLIFQYLNMLRESGVQKWIFEEAQKISEIDFRFQGKQNPADYVQKIADYCQDYDYPLKEILVGRYWIEEWRPDLIDMLLTDYLTPSNVVVTIVGQKFRSIANEVEQWYGTKYKFGKIQEGVIQKWKDCGTREELRLPDPNEFISSNFDIFFNGENKPRHPLIVHENDLVRVWLKQDDEFLLPKANLKFEFFTPLAFLDPFCHNLTYIFIELLKDALIEYTHYATLGGLYHVINVTDYGFHLYLSGFSDKQNVFLEKILERMSNFKIDPQRFYILKEDYIRHLRNFEGCEPHEQIWFHLQWLLTEKSWTMEELLEATTQMTIESVEEFIPQLLSKLYVECLFHGNVDEERARSLIHITHSKLFPRINRPLLPQEIVRYREIILNDGEYVVQEVTNQFHKNSCAQVYYQCCPLSTENNMLMELLNQILEVPYFDILRTKEQLGYSIWCDIWRSASVQGLRIVVQSDKHPSFVDQRIESFLVRMREILEGMSEEEFERNKEALAVVRLEKPKELSGLTDTFWKEIISRQYHFNRDEIEVAYLRTINKSDLTKFFDEYIKNDGPKRRKVSVYIISGGEGGVGVSTSDLGSLSNMEPSPTKIKDINKFKRSHALYPLTEPYIDIRTLKVE